MTPDITDHAARRWRERFGAPADLALVLEQSRRLTRSERRRLQMRPGCHGRAHDGLGALLVCCDQNGRRTIVTVMGLAGATGDWAGGTGNRRRK